MEPLQPAHEEANNFVNDVFGRVTAMAALRCAISLKLLDGLPASGATATLKDLSNQTGASEEVIRRLFLPLTAMGILENPQPSCFGHTSLSLALRDPRIQGYFTFGWDHCLPAFNKLHEWFEKSEWREPSGVRDCAWAMTHNGQGLFEALSLDPKMAANFNAMNEHMSFPVAGIYPIEDAGVDWNEERALLVDVGGGKGQACRELVHAHPVLKNLIVLQDQKEVPDQVPADVASSVKKMCYNFFTPQPIRGANFYHLRRIMCDWPDKECELILRNQASAMSQNSRLLIATLVVPEQGCDPLTDGMDISTIMYAGKERTLKQFHMLLASAGLRIEKVWNNEGEFVSILESRLMAGSVL